MSTLSDRYKSLGIKLGGSQPTINSLETPRKAVIPIEEVVPGIDFETIHGKSFITIREFDANYVHGDHKLLVQRSLKLISEWGQTPNVSNLARTQIAFLDTETSGLSGGTGTYAFLIGLGYFTESSFKVVQFFMRDPSQEAALLTALDEWLTPFKAIITYNGKSFDLPLLKTRYMINDLKAPFVNFDHVDLLHLARRIWRNRLESRALGDLEKEIIGFIRDQEEVPGYLIPQFYFDYLHTQNSAPLAGVFYHNVYDIVTLASLFGFLADLLEDPTGDIVPSLDVVAIAKLYEDLGRLEIAANLYEAGISQGLPDNFYLATLERFARLRKKQGFQEEALSLWVKAAQRGDLVAFVELSKYYEHTSKDYQTAITWSREGLAQLKKIRIPKYQIQIWEDEFTRRLIRLEKKTSRSA